MNVLKKIFVSAVAAAVIFCSCTKKEVDSAASAAAVSEKETAAGIQGVVYVTKTGLYIENDEGKMKWAAEAALGDLPYYLGEKKEAQRTDGQKRTFFYVELNGNRYWIQDYSYEPRTTPGFIMTKDAVLYKSASLTAASDEILPQYLPVAVYNDFAKDPGGKFFKIAAYSSEFYTTWTIKEKFVKRDAVEMNEENISAMYLALAASESRNDTIRAELFQNAIEMDSSYSLDIADLQNLTEIIIKEETFMQTLSPEKINEPVLIEADIDLKSVPCRRKSARVLHTLKEGSSATATLKLVCSDPENDDSEAEWLYIQNKQKKGWVTADEVKRQ
ncbi:hypothetical protein H0R92_03710 [Treponema sp. OMZ 840]|uniref:hypothetical protein n=1 Tax=Treponema sp. OMZ 840 TaxID=244313 RepID=UPI003D91635B